VTPHRRGFVVGSRRAQEVAIVANPVRGDVISLASRRRPVAAAPVRAPAPATKRRPVAALAAGATLLVVVLAVGTRPGARADIGRLSPGDRARIFGRALEDLRTACADPARLDGALRDHCRAQAEFVTLFPECDRVCQTIATALLPHARR
jgi:cytochrome b pre-mRNA-processing protein 3